MSAAARIHQHGITLGYFGGNCPVEVEGIFDFKVFYFRARGSRWEFHVARRQIDIFKNDLFVVEREYGDGPYDAGWMQLDEALNFVCDSVEEFRAKRRAEGPKR